MDAHGRTAGIVFRSGIGLAILLGVLFRFHGLADRLVWHDEIVTRVLAAGYTTDDWKADLYTGRLVSVADVTRFQQYDPDRSLSDVVNGLADHEPQHPPLYYTLARIWVGISGDDVATLRALSAIFGLLFLPACGWLCFEVTRSRRAVWTGMAVAAVSPFFVLYSQEAREYALWAVWVACSCAALLRAIRRDAEGTGRSKLAWVAFSLATVAGLYTSFSMVAVSLAQAVFVAIRERGRPTRIVLRTAVALAGAGLAFLPWITGFLEAFDRFQATMTWSERIEIPRLQLLQELGINVARTLVDFWPDPEGLLPGAVTACAAGLILLAIRRTARVPDTGLLPALVLVVPIASLLLPDLVFGGIRSISARYLTPAWVVSVAALACLPWIGQARKWTGTLLVAALAVGIASNIAGAGRDVTWTKGISRGLPEVAERVNQAESPLVIGNEERYNPGNLLALAVLLKPDANMQLLKIAAEKDHVLPPHPGEVFLFTPTDPFRHALEVRESVGTRLVFRDLHLDLWRIERPARTTTRTTP